MPHFDNDYIHNVLGRLRRLAPEVQPQWGSLTPGDMINHLIGSVKYSMGRLPSQARKVGRFRRLVVRPLLLHGWIAMPRNIRVEDSGLPLMTAQGDIETLHAVLEEYLALVQADELTPPPHPALGALCVDEWARLHYVHFEHHLRQFGV
jgi:hypothetical protein